MKLPFTPYQFLEVFKNYNLTVWPAQLVLFTAALGILAMIKMNRGLKLSFLILGLMWIWMAFVYHLSFFSVINTAALLFGAFFILQALYLFYCPFQDSVHFTNRWNLKTKTAAIIIFYALVLYPVIGNFSGHAYPYSPTFGLPCPTTIFTFGILMLIKERIPVFIYIIPVLWTLLATSAVFSLGMNEDLGLPAAAISFLLFNRRKKVATTMVIRKTEPSSLGHA
jgi:hypothetical protein